MKEKLRMFLNKFFNSDDQNKSTEHFWKQRFTAIASIPIVIFYIILILKFLEKDYRNIHSILSNPIISIILIFALSSSVYHMKLGMQVIIEDYFSIKNLRNFFIIFNNLFSFLIAFISIIAILKILGD